MKKIISQIFCVTFLTAYFAILPASWSQEGEGAAPAEETTEAAPQETVQMRTGGIEPFDLPKDENTYIVTYNLRGLQCVKDVGTATQCAVTNPSADEGGYPWTKVQCRPGDASVSTFAWSLDYNKPMGIFEAPTQLITYSNTYPINVRLGRVCMKKPSAKK